MGTQNRPPKPMYRYRRLTILSAAITRLVGHPITFVTVAGLVVLWWVVWFFRKFDVGWLTVFSTLTMVATFLLVFIIQNNQDREAAVIEIKLNELIRASNGAHNALLDLEMLPEQDLEFIRAGYADLAAHARDALKKGQVQLATAVVEVRSLTHLVNPEQILRDPKRLAALERLRWVDTPPEEYLDQLTRLAQLALGAPVTLLSLVTPDRQFFKSQAGLKPPHSETRQVPLSHSFCKHVVVSGKPFIVNDARQNPIVRDNEAVKDLNIVAYCGVPLISRDDQQPLGSFCAIDTRPRVWQQRELEILEALSALATLHIRQRPRLSS